MRDVARFRKTERARLMEARRRISSSDRTAMTTTLAGALDAIAASRPGLRIAVCWPIRGEPDLREWSGRAHSAGANVLLPVVVENAAPRIFRSFSPSCPMERGIWNIPEPSEGHEMVPDVVVADDSV
nr:5-formyltetrahydrofolate cyclo-ligase [uncultured Jannaschia sp.]